MATSLLRLALQKDVQYEGPMQSSPCKWITVAKCRCRRMTCSLGTAANLASICILQHPLVIVKYRSSHNNPLRSSSKFIGRLNTNAGT